MTETQEEQRRRLNSMSDEIERLKNDEGFNPDVDGDKAEIRKHLAQKWPTLSPREIDQAFDWWHIDIPDRAMGEGRFKPRSSDDSVHC